MTTRDNQAHLVKMYGVEVSPTEVSQVTRAVQDIFIACVDGLKGFPETIETVFPILRLSSALFTCSGIASTAFPGNSARKRLLL